MESKIPKDKRTQRNLFFKNLNLKANDEEYYLTMEKKRM